MTENEKNAQPTSAKQWKASQNQALTLPSGNVALVRSPGMQAFLRAGMIPNSLMPYVTEALSRGKPPSTEALKEKLGSDVEMLKEMLVAIDEVTIYCVVEPTVVRIPEQGEPRQEEILYIDEVDSMDKLFIFNWAVGGTRDLARFRQEYETGMDNVQHSPDMADATQRDGGD